MSPSSQGLGTDVAISNEWTLSKQNWPQQASHVPTTQSSRCRNSSRINWHFCAFSVTLSWQNLWNVCANHQPTQPCQRSYSSKVLQQPLACEVVFIVVQVGIAFILKSGWQFLSDLSEQLMLNVSFDIKWWDTSLHLRTWRDPFGFLIFPVHMGE